MRTDIVLEDADHIWENLFLMLFGVGYSTAVNSDLAMGPPFFSVCNTAEIFIAQLFMLKTG